MFSLITLLLLAQSPDARAREALERAAPKPSVKASPFCCCGTNCTCIDCPAKRQAPAPSPVPERPAVPAPPAVEAPKLLPPPAGVAPNTVATFAAVNGKWVQTWSKDGKQHTPPNTAVPGVSRSVQAGNPATDPFHPANENPNWDCSSGKCVRRR